MDAAWNAHHTEAHGKFTPGAVYDPDPAIKTVSGTGYKYIAVMHSNGRVLDYSSEFRPNTTRAQAIAEVIREFPSDVKIVWQKQLDVCYQMEFQSAQLHRAVPTDVEDGLVSVFFFHYDNQGNALPNTKVIQEAMVMDLAQRTPTVSTGC